MFFFSSWMMKIHSIFKRPKAYPYLYRRLIYDWASITGQWAKNELFNKWFWVNWLSTWKTGNQSPVPQLSTVGRLQLHWRLLVKTKIIKLLADNTEGQYWVLMWGKIPKGEESERLFRSLVWRMSKKMSHKIISFNNYKRLICRIYRELLKINMKKRKNLLE